MHFILDLYPWLQLARWYRSRTRWSVELEAPVLEEVLHSDRVIAHSTYPCESCNANGSTTRPTAQGLCLLLPMPASVTHLSSCSSRQEPLPKSVEHISPGVVETHGKLWHVVGIRKMKRLAIRTGERFDKRNRTRIRDDQTKKASESFLRGATLRLSRVPSRSTLHHLGDLRIERVARDGSWLGPRWLGVFLWAILF